MRRTVTATLAGMLLLLLVSGLAGAQETLEPELTSDEIVERILELRRELDALMEALPADLRHEIERRLEPPRMEQAIEPVQASEIVDMTTELTPAPGPLPELPEAPEVAVAPEPAAVATSEAASSLPPAEVPAAVECVDLAEFDTNEDGAVSGFDRYWRYFKLWFDDGDGAITENELKTLYDSGIGAVSAKLRSYTDLDGGKGDVVVSQHILLDVPGGKTRTAVLTIDAGRLARGGEFELRDELGTGLDGLQILDRRTVIAVTSGGERALICP